MPKPGFLEQSKQLAKDHDVLLIFDETITGLRMSLGGAQEIFDVIPDITIGCKALGNGFPISGYGANEEIMETVSSGKTAHAGTFNGNALSCASSIAVLDQLSKNNQESIKYINRLGTLMAEEIKQLAYENGITLRVTGVGSFFSLTLPDNDVVDDYTICNFDAKTTFQFRRCLLDNNVHVGAIPNSVWFLSTAHTEDDIEKTLKAIHCAFRHIKIN